MNYLDLNKYNTCSCGSNIESEIVDIQIKYTFIGWFWWSMGATAIPKEVSFKCKSCNQTFETLTNRDDIRHYIYYRRH